MKLYSAKGILYNIIYMQNLFKKMLQMNLFTKQKQPHRLRVRTYDYQQGWQSGGRES